MTNVLVRYYSIGVQHVINKKIVHPPLQRKKNLEGRESNPPIPKERVLGGSWRLFWF
jgi:hypothetical protein